MEIGTLVLNNSLRNPVRLAAQYGDAWNIGYMGTPDTMAGPMAKIEAACRQVGRDPATIDVIPLIGLWFRELEAEKPTIFDDPLTGSAPELAALQRLTEAVHLYRGME